MQMVDHLRFSGRPAADVMFVVLTVLQTVSLQTISIAEAAPPDSPYVAGFERFARPGEIAPEVGGRLLVSELSCTACHSSPSELLTAKRGPILAGAGNRLNHQWIRSFLAAPHQMKPGTTMPDILGGLPAGERNAAINALVAFIGSLERPYPEFKGTGAKPVPSEFWNLGDARAGRQLYHRIGCVACHAADVDYETVETKPTPLDELLQQLDPAELKEMGLATAARRVTSVPLGDLPAKYNRKALTHFLLAPHSTRPAGRMPDFQLGLVEAADIAAWLLQDQVPGTAAEIKAAESRDVPQVRASIADAPSAAPSGANSLDSSLVAQGRDLFTSLRCVNCHAIDGLATGPPAMPLARLDRSVGTHCYGTAGKNAPGFSLDDDQVASVKLALAAVAARSTSGDDGPERGTSSAVAAPSPESDQLQLGLLRLNCLACHTRDKQGGVGRYRRAFFETYGNIDIGDEGRLPPPLTGVGRKLKPAWLSRVLQGNGSIRRHMRIRMPVFPAAHVKDLPAQFAMADGGARQQSEHEVFGDAGPLAEPGRALLDTGCVQCHPLRGNALSGVVGIDLAGVTDRVQPEWFREFLLNPSSLKPRTRMPTFFPQGMSQNPNVLAGDADRQIAAMWAYLKDVEKHRLPDKIEAARSQSYELVPDNRPILLRTFMEKAGTHAIAVGFPEMVHFAFDAEHVRLALAWRGRFLDAEGTWFVRFAPPAQPLGTDQIRFPAGVPLAVLPDAASPWPRTDVDQDTAEGDTYRYFGYKLDQSGVPTFQYRYNDYDVHDRIQPQAGHLLRKLTITKRQPFRSRATLWLRGHAGKSLQRDGRLSYTSETGLQTSIQHVDAAGELRRQETIVEWIIPLNFDRQTTVEMRYQW